MGRSCAPAPSCSLSSSVVTETVPEATFHVTAGVQAHASATSVRAGGVIFAKLFPNAEEPLRGVFVAEQLRATRSTVDWAVVAPVPWVPRGVARVFDKPYVEGDSRLDGVAVLHPRYPALPRRQLYATVAPLMALTARRAFERACESVDAAFVHAHDLYPSGAAARRLCERAGLPYVLTVHGSDLYSNLGNPRWRAEIREAAQGARALICVASRLARDCISELGVGPERTVVIPDTYDASRFALIERARKPGPVRLVTLGRLSPEKGQDVLLHALADARSRGGDATLDLVGDGPEREALEALRDGLGLADIVRFAGALAPDRLPELFAAADVFVLPSRAEGFGVALVEAMATGLPVVATRSGGPEDIVRSGDGVLVAPDDVRALADGIATLVEHRADYDSREIAARVSERFAPEAVGARLTRLYAQVLAGDTLSGAVDSGDGS